MRNSSELKSTFKATPPLITQAGLVLEVVKETKCRVSGRVVDLFFPVHDTARFGKYQISPESQTHLRERLVSHTREFWKTGSRAGYEVGGQYRIQP